jgi:hypothetical protein
MPARPPATEAPPVPVGSIACETCQHFTPDPLNPPAGMGTCALDLGRWHAGAPHRCTGHQPIQR